LSVPPISVSLTVTAQGAQPTAPSTIYANFITLVAAYDPGYTVLPAGLVEDLASTSLYNLALVDSLCVELINSLTPYTANPFILTQQGQLYGVAQGTDTNGSVFVVFTSNTPGFQIPLGWIVGDGTNQYVVQDGGVIESGGSSAPLFCVASTAGTFAIPANSVTTTVTQPPAGSGITVTVNNPTAGTPSAGPQTEWAYRTAVLNAGLTSGTGTPSFLKTQLGEVAGVNPLYVSVRLITVPATGWEVICGGGDPYAVANAIYASGLDLSTLVGSDNVITAASLTNPCVITTSLFHGFTNGQTGVVISGAMGLTGINGTWTVTTTGFPPNQFSIAYNATGGPAYSGGGTVTPNSGTARNVTVNLNDYPDTYPVTYVNPPAQAVTVQLTWNTISPNFVSDTAVAQLGATAISAYVSGLPVGTPINTNAMGAAFIAAVAPLFTNNAASAVNNAAELISELVWTVSINGVDISPVSSTYLIYGDPEGFFVCPASSVTVTQA
jgi:hypothetical protein